MAKPKFIYTLAQTYHRPNAARLYNIRWFTLTNGTTFVIGRLYVPFEVRIVTTRTLPFCPGCTFSTRAMGHFQRRIQVGAQGARAPPFPPLGGVSSIEVEVVWLGSEATFTFPLWITLSVFEQ